MEIVIFNNFFAIYNWTFSFFLFIIFFPNNGGEIKKENKKELEDETTIKKHKIKSKHASFKKASVSSSDETDSSESSSGSETSESSNSSTSYEDTSDIYRATETEDGLNKAYKKINKEMELMSKNQKGGKISGKEVVK